ncbi:hypothetical protein K2X33_07125 [bacterium]|nr:hypothetical protein [bacterium]
MRSVVFAWLATATCLSHATETVKATLFEGQSGALYEYTLLKDRTGTTDTWSSRYQDTSGQDFARETTTMNDGRLVDYRLSLPQQAESAEIHWDGKTLTLRYTRAGKTEQATETWEQAPIVGSQLVNTIVRHAEQLQAGTPLEVRFIVAERLETLGFRLSAVKDSPPEQAVYEFKPSNFFIRQIVDPIRVTLDKKTNRVLSIEGRSFLKKKAGTSWEPIVGRMVFLP